jgi:hypothetical protein
MRACDSCGVTTQPRDGGPRQTRMGVCRLASTRGLTDTCQHIPRERGGGTGGPVGTIYALDIGIIGRDAATYVVNLLQGPKPECLPVEQRAKFELVIGCYS